jgi:hypothetical protein
MVTLKEREPLKEALIHNIQVHPSIWDKRSKDYKDNYVKLNSWMEILSNLRAAFSPEQLRASKMTSLKDIKATWKNLRTIFNEKKKKMKERPGAGNLTNFAFHYYDDFTPWRMTCFVTT